MAIFYLATKKNAFFQIFRQVANDILYSKIENVFSKDGKLKYIFVKYLLQETSRLAIFKIESQSKTASRMFQNYINSKIYKIIFVQPMFVQTLFVQTLFVQTLFVQTFFLIPSHDQFSLIWTNLIHFDQI